MCMLTDRNEYVLKPKLVIVVSDWIGDKSATESAKTAQIHIILHMRHVLSGSLLSIDIVCII